MAEEFPADEAFPADEPVASGDNFPADEDSFPADDSGAVIEVPESLSQPVPTEETPPTEVAGVTPKTGAGEPTAPGAANVPGIATPILDEQGQPRVIATGPEALAETQRRGGAIAKLNIASAIFDGVDAASEPETFSKNFREGWEKVKAGVSESFEESFARRAAKTSRRANLMPGSFVPLASPDAEVTPLDIFVAGNPQPSVEVERDADGNISSARLVRPEDFTAPTPEAEARMTAMLEGTETPDMGRAPAVLGFKLSPEGAAFVAKNPIYQIDGVSARARAEINRPDNALGIMLSGGSLAAGQKVAPDANTATIKEEVLNEDFEWKVNAKNLVDLVDLENEVNPSNFHDPEFVGGMFMTLAGVGQMTGGEEAAKVFRDRMRDMYPERVETTNMLYNAAVNFPIDVTAGSVGDLTTTGIMDTVATAGLGSVIKLASKALKGTAALGAGMTEKTLNHLMQLESRKEIDALIKQARALKAGKRKQIEDIVADRHKKMRGRDRGPNPITVGEIDTELIRINAEIVERIHHPKRYQSGLPILRDVAEFAGKVRTVVSKNPIQGRPLGAQKHMLGMGTARSVGMLKGERDMVFDLIKDTTGEYKNRARFIKSARKTANGTDDLSDLSNLAGLVHQEIHGGYLGGKFLSALDDVSKRLQLGVSSRLTAGKASILERDTLQAMFKDIDEGLEGFTGVRPKLVRGGISGPAGKGRLQAGQSLDPDLAFVNGDDVIEQLAEARATAAREAFREARRAGGELDDVKAYLDDIIKNDTQSAGRYTADDVLDLMEDMEVMWRRKGEPLGLRNGNSLSYGMYFHNTMRPEIQRSATWNLFKSATGISMDKAIGALPTAVGGAVRSVFPARQKLSSRLQRTGKVALSDRQDLDLMKVMQNELSTRYAVNHYNTNLDKLLANPKFFQRLKTKRVNGKTVPQNPDGLEIIPISDLPKLSGYIRTRMIGIDPRKYENLMTKEARKAIEDPGGASLNNMRTLDVNIPIDEVQMREFISGRKFLAMDKDVLDYFKTVSAEIKGLDAFDAIGRDLVSGFKTLGVGFDAVGLGTRYVLNGQQFAQMGPRAWGAAVAEHRGLSIGKAEADRLVKMTEEGALEWGVMGLKENLGSRGATGIEGLLYKTPGFGAYLRMNDRIMFENSLLWPSWSVKRRLVVGDQIRDLLKKHGPNALASPIEKRAGTAAADWMDRFFGTRNMDELIKNRGIIPEIRYANDVNRMLGEYTSAFRSPAQQKIAANIIPFYGFGRGLLMSKLTAPLNHPMRAAAYPLIMMEGMNRALNGGDSMMDNPAGRMTSVQINPAKIAGMLDSSLGTSFQEEVARSQTSMYLNAPSTLSAGWKVADVETVMTGARIFWETPSWRTFQMLSATSPGIFRRALGQGVNQIAMQSMNRSLFMSFDDLDSEVGSQMGAFFKGINHNLFEVAVNIKRLLTKAPDQEVALEVMRGMAELTLGVNISSDPSWSGMRRRMDVYEKSLNEDIFEGDEPGKAVAPPFLRSMWKKAREVDKRVNLDQRDTGSKARESLKQRFRSKQRDRRTVRQKDVAETTTALDRRKQKRVLNTKQARRARRKLNLERP